MITRLLNYMYDLRDRQRINICLAKGGAMMNARKIDLRRPSTWEFSGFSQNGEDGILDVLRSQLTTHNRYFIEIGSSDGIENNSSWLVIAEKLGGLMVEGSPRLAERTQRMIINYSIASESVNMFISLKNVDELKKKALNINPDIFSIDIDGNDYYIAKAVLDGGFRPKIFVVEYNSVYGRSDKKTIIYDENFVFTKADPSNLYYGVSIAGWKSFFNAYGYKFVTVERNGVNAFFVDPANFDEKFLQNIEGLEFAENQFQLRKFRVASESQFKYIKNKNYFEID